ncbi:MAG: peptidoglycan DD-metalloendopeptidase family protein [Gammaproteobacteria bacterium]
MVYYGKPLTRYWLAHRVIRLGAIVFIALLFLTACSSTVHYAPVVDGWKQPIGKQGYHRVGEGETLYSIAWQYGLDYRQLVTINQLQKPYTLHSGELLALVSYSKGKTVVNKTINKPSANKKSLRNTTVHRRESQLSSSPFNGIKTWHWPVRGVIVQDYQTSAMGSKGLDIGGKRGSLIKTTAPGTVVYSGNGIRGYGNLLIIKHNGLYLSAYGHNQQLLVHEGDVVKQDQTIATMGLNEKGNPMLHFEIRRAGKPVNPHYYLPAIH